MDPPMNRDTTPKRIPAASKILIIGASGFIGSATTWECLSAGYRVKAVTRDLDKTHEFDALLQDTFGQDACEWATVEDLSDHAAFATHFTDTDAVIHIAAKNSMSPDTANVVDAAVQDTLALMQQAAKYPNIASYVLTSSRTAAFQPKGTSEVEMYDQSSWNESVVEAAYSRCERDARKGALSYMASKVRGEQAAWQYYRDAKPHYAFNTILPDLVLGAVRNPHKGFYTTHTRFNEFVSTRSQDKHSLFYQFLNPPSTFASVDDVAKLHLIAATDASVQGKRLFAMTDTWCAEDVVAVLRRIAPERPRNDLPDIQGWMQRSNLSLPSDEYRQLLQAHYGVSPTGLEDVVKDNMRGQVDWMSMKV